MPLPADILTQLADVLAELYSDHASARTMATTAGVPVERIPVDDKPLGYWVNLLQEAENRGLTQAVLDRATAQYPTNPALAAVRQAYSAWALPPLPPRDLPEKPFRYLDWYRRADAEVFFGRGRKIRELLDDVTAADGPPIILLYGQSGVGKSSLLAAGLIPRLESTYAVHYVRRDQDKGLPGTLAGALGAAPGDDLRAVWHRREEEVGQPLVLILDQVEEVITRANPQQPNELADFLDALEGLFADAGGRPKGRLILSFRKEWLAEIKARLVERSLPRDEVFVERLGRAGIAAVVAGPQSSPRLRAHYGLEVATALPGLIADDLLADRESPVAPMLAILLTDMWDAAKKRSYDHPVFDEDLYHDFRTRGLSLNDFLGRQLRTLHDQLPEVVDSGLALDVLAFHTTPLGTAAQRMLADLEQTYSHRRDVLPGLVQQCQDLYLLVDPAKNQPDQPPASRLAHDTLAPHVRKRFDESDAPGQRARRILETRTQELSPELKQRVLLGVPELQVVRQGASGMPAWSHDQRTLVNLSQQRATRIRWLQRLALVMLVVLAAIPVFQQVQDYVLRQRADRPQVTFPAAVVRMGDTDPAESRTYPPRDVALAAYAIDKYEVSYDQYRLCLQAGRCSHPREPAQTQGFDDIETAAGDLPVVWVDAYQAAAFCRWMGRRLPTEAEWERAARGDTFRDYPWGKYVPDPVYVNAYLPDYPDAGPTQTAGVAGPAFAAGATPEGIMHLLGNVSEWTAATEACQDDAYDCDVIWNGIQEVSTVFTRGGSWEAELVSPAYFDSVDPLQTDDSIGFRCAQDVT